MTRAMILLLDCSLTFANFQEKCKIDKILPLRSSDQRCSVRKGALRNFKKLTGKQLWQSLFLIKLQVFLQLYLKKRLRHRCFSVNFAKFLRIPFLQNTSGRLLLEIKIQRPSFGMIANFAHGVLK